MGQAGIMRVPTQIRAIETEYNGYRFRSRLEARYAIFFDALGMPYEYETEGFELPSGQWYLPDFYLPDLDIFIEIKGKGPTFREVRKMALLSHGLGRRVFTFWGNIGLPKVRFPIATPEERQYNAEWKLRDGCLGIGALPQANPSVDIKTIIDLDVVAWADSPSLNLIEPWPYYAHKTTYLLLPGVLDLDAPTPKPDWHECKFMITPIYPKGYSFRGYWGDGRFYDSDRLKQAYRAARSARFGT